MRMRTTAIIVALLGCALWVAPAQAKLVYVKEAGTASPVVYVSKDSGKDPRRLGIGRAPTISPNGGWVAFVTVPMGQSDMDTVVLQKLKAGSQRLVMRSKSIDSLRFSPDSKQLAWATLNQKTNTWGLWTMPLGGGPKKLIATSASVPSASAVSVDITAPQPWAPEPPVCSLQHLRRAD